jgi:AbrB family looped-hinge helix DNA binding protein
MPNGIQLITTRFMLTRNNFGWSELTMNQSNSAPILGRCYTIDDISIIRGVIYMTMAIISPKGGIVIPANLRKKYNLQPGDRVMLVDYGGVLAIVPTLSKPVADAAGLLKGGPSLTKTLMAEHKRQR